MGSGKKFEVYQSEGYGLGIHFMKFPFQYTLFLELICITVRIGFGKGYNE